MCTALRHFSQLVEMCSTQSPGPSPREQLSAALDSVLESTKLELTYNN